MVGCNKYDNAFSFNVAHEKACHTCTEGTHSIRIAIGDNKSFETDIFETSSIIPDWYKKEGIYSPLPPQFTCDDRYKNKPRVHMPENANNSDVYVDISNTDLAPDSMIAYWASKPNTSVQTASSSYDKFENSGIVKCKDSVCKIKLELPTSYSVDNEIHPPHIHMTDWQGDTWNTKAKTILLNKLST
jgi:hypothetical protein